MNDQQLIEHLKLEVRRVKIQRNEIEQDLFKAQKRVRELVWQSNELFSKLKKEVLNKPLPAPIDKAVEPKEWRNERTIEDDLGHLVTEHIADTGKMIETEDELWNENDYIELIDIINSHVLSQEQDTSNPDPEKRYRLLGVQDAAEEIAKKFTRKTTPNE